jgi:ABC-type branched-subunit amino acid transport system permease subunit
VALSQIDNVSPTSARATSSTALWSWCSAASAIWGTLVGAMTLGIANKFLEPVAGAVLGKIAILVLIILSSRSGRAVCSRSRASRWKHDRRTFSPDRSTERDRLPADRGCRRHSCAAVNLLLPASSPFQVPTYLMALFGKYLCYAILALSIDLIWGYCGILSLGHGAFFALGGYAMGMYLMRQIGSRGVYGNRSCRISWCS